MRVSTVPSQKRFDIALSISHENCPNCLFRGRRNGLTLFLQARPSISRLRAERVRRRDRLFDSRLASN